jgi:ligand-binding sensor domain-containing protein
LWVGTFNGGLAKQDEHGRIRPFSSPGMLVNALVTGPSQLFLGTAEGLFKTKDGTTFEQVKLVEQAVVGLAYDGTSIWVTTPGALYRIRDGHGPRSDIWWMPGGSRSLQKVSAVPGYVWFRTEDRGAIRMKIGPTTVARDKPFTVYDRGQGLTSSWSLAVAARPDGSAWMTTLREGVTFIPRHGESVRVPTGVSDWGLSALAVEDGVFIGSQNGATFVKNNGEHSHLVRQLPDARVHAFLLDDRNKKTRRLWIGTENGLAKCELT